MKFKIFVQILPIVVASSLIIACGETNGPSLLSSSSTTIPSVAPTPARPLVFTNGQAASAVYGQPDFTTATTGTTANKMNYPFGLTVGDNGVVYVGDYNNARVVGFNSVPTGLPSPNADFVLGQPNFTTSTETYTATTVGGPMGLLKYGSKFIVVDNDGNRILIYNSIPNATNSGPAVSPGPSAAVVMGQTNKTNHGQSCAAAGLYSPVNVVIFNGKLIVSDTENNRILIYNSLPTADGASADLVVGQPDMTTCTAGTTASKLRAPHGIWTDGTRLVVADGSNGRLMIWNSFPTTNGQVADLEIGQPNFTTMGNNTGGLSAHSMYQPAGLLVNAAGQLFMTDYNNGRVMIWNTFPTTNNQDADAVLGKSNFTDATYPASASNVEAPWDLAVDATHLFLVDQDASRVLVYTSQ